MVGQIALRCLLSVAAIIILLPLYPAQASDQPPTDLQVALLTPVIKELEASLPHSWLSTREPGASGDARRR
jgi:hypothetical protein